MKFFSFIIIITYIVFSVLPFGLQNLQDIYYPAPFFFFFFFDVDHFKVFIEFVTIFLLFFCFGFLRS